MGIVIGMDTGGTYTDSVLLDIETKTILSKATAFTTKEDLSIGIANSLSALGEIPSPIEKVVLSTTLATNAVVEHQLHPVGAVFIGKTPKGDMPALCTATIQGKINVKGREEIRIDEEEVQTMIADMAKSCKAIAVTGYMSVRNPVQEQKVKELIQADYDIPVVCGHELSSSLGFSERATTAILNAALLPIIAEFLDAIQKVMTEKNITAPIFMVRGNGTMADLNTIRRSPVETILSGPATSIIGAMYLSDLQNAVICDMGGTTTDTARLKNGEIRLSATGASIGPWQTQIPSAELYTCGIGGDSAITYKENTFQIGPRRALPLCRGGEQITPTDLLHAFGYFAKWDKEASQRGLEHLAQKAGKTTELCGQEIKETILEQLVQTYRKQSDENLPVIAIGAPVRYWFEEASKAYGFPLVIPEHHEVANAIGAAAAELKETVCAIVRPGEDGHGYLIHTPNARYSASTKEEAVDLAVTQAKDEVAARVRAQGAKNITIDIDQTDIYCNETEISNRIYIETRITATAVGSLF